MKNENYENVKTNQKFTKLIQQYQNRYFIKI